MLETHVSVRDTCNDKRHRCVRDLLCYAGVLVRVLSTNVRGSVCVDLCVCKSVCVGLCVYAR